MMLFPLQTRALLSAQQETVALTCCVCVWGGGGGGACVCVCVHVCVCMCVCVCVCVCACVCVCVPYYVVDQGTGQGELESSPGARPLSGGRAVSRPTRLHSGV